MPTRKPAGASARPAARKRASASSKSAPRKKRAPASPKPRTNSAHYKPAPRKKLAARRKSDARKAAPKRIKATPPPREADPFAKKTGRRRAYYTGEFLAVAKWRIENTPQSTTAIANELGMDKSVLGRLIKSEGWVRPEGSQRLRGLSPAMRLAAEADALSASAHSRESGNPTEDTQASESDALGPRFRGDERANNTPGTSTIDRLEAAVLKELSVVEKMRASLGTEPLRPMDAERTARTLSTLTETLAKLRRLRLGSTPHAGSGHDDDILDIDAFRLDFARRIDAFVASRTDARSAGAAGPAERSDPV